MITSTKSSVTVVTLSINDNIKYLENIKQRFKRTISWNNTIKNRQFRPSDLSNL